MRCYGAATTAFPKLILWDSLNRVRRSTPLKASHAVDVSERLHTQEPWARAGDLLIIKAIATLEHQEANIETESVPQQSWAKMQYGVP